VGSIIERIERALGVPGLAARLVEQLEPSDLQSLLLDVQRRSALARSAPGILAQYAESRFVRAAAVPPRQLAEWDRVAFASLPPGFEALELSPVCPLGTSSVVAGVSQNWSVATVRNTEVVSDSTNVLALEAALRRRALLAGAPRSSEPVHLAASQRLLRAQNYRSADLVPHFRLFALCSAGRDLGASRFEAEALAAHIGFHLSAARAFLGPSLRLRVSLTALGRGGEPVASVRQAIEDAAADRENVEVVLDPDREAGRGYYSGLCFYILADSGAGVQLADGGVVDWTQRYLSNAKERLVISGIGSERLCQLRDPSAPTRR
jgi:hypothetical protein